MLSTVILTTLIPFMAVVLTSPLSSSNNIDELSLELDKVHEIRSLLDNLLYKKRHQAENSLQRRINDVVKRVFYAQSYEDEDDDDLVTRKNAEGTCSNGERYTCTNNLCDKDNTAKCRALCDAFPLGPNRERYSCRCKPSGHGLYCNVTENGLCHKNCPNPNHCYEMDISLSGYFCYYQNWTIQNPKAVLERSLSEVETMGKFARVVETLIKRDCKNC